MKPGEPLRFLRDLALVFVLLGAALWVAGRFVAHPWVVEGRSMEPTLRAGDRVLVELWSYRRRAPRIGEVVLLDGPRGLPLVKRVVGREGAERFRVAGDNPAGSLDSVDFGPLSRERLTGRVVFRYWPPSRVGRIR